MEDKILDNLSEEAPQLVPASRAKRFFAFLIDILPLTLLAGVFYHYTFGFDTLFDYLENRGDIGVRSAFIKDRNRVRFFAFGLYVLYALVTEGSAWHGTFGKRLLGIRVVDEYGEPLDRQRAASRNLGKILSYLPLSLGFIWILFDKKRQGWHDKMARTLVVEK